MEKLTMHDDGSFTVGMWRELKIGDRIDRVVFDGVWVDQPCIVVGVSDFQGWLESCRALVGEPDFDEIRQALQPEARFYRVISD